MPDWDWLHHWNVLQWKWPRNCLKWTSLVPCDWSKLCCQAWKQGRMGASLTTAVTVVLLHFLSLRFTVLQSSQWKALLRGWHPWCFILISGTKYTFTRPQNYPYKNSSIKTIRLKLFTPFTRPQKSARHTICVASKCVDLLIDWYLRILSKAVDRSTSLFLHPALPSVAFKQVKLLLEIISKLHDWGAGWLSGSFLLLLSSKKTWVIVRWLHMAMGNNLI